MCSECGTTTVGGIEVNLLGFVAVGAGAAAGAWLRWWLGILFNPVFPTLPLGTLAANLLGGFLMGLAMGFLSHFEALAPEVRLLVTTGFLGGLTTFSTFSAETVTLILHEQLGWTAVIILVHVAGSVLMTLAGIGVLRMSLKALGA
jgi:fluoride exporter